MLLLNADRDPRAVRMKKWWASPLKKKADSASTPSASPPALSPAAAAADSPDAFLRRLVDGTVINPSEVKRALVADDIAENEALLSQLASGCFNYCFFATCADADARADPANCWRYDGFCSRRFCAAHFVLQLL